MNRLQATLKRHEWIVVLVGALLASGSFLTKDHWADEAKDAASALKQAKNRYDSLSTSTMYGDLSIANLRGLTMLSIRVEGILIHPKIAKGSKPDAKAAYEEWFDTYHLSECLQLFLELRQQKEMAAALPEKSAAVRQVEEQLSDVGGKLVAQYNRGFINKYPAVHLPVLDAATFSKVDSSAPDPKMLIQTENDAKALIVKARAVIGEQYETQLRHAERRVTHLQVLSYFIFFTGLTLTAAGKVTKSYEMDRP